MNKMKLCRARLHDLDAPKGRTTNGACRPCTVVRNRLWSREKYKTDKKFRKYKLEESRRQYQERKQNPKWHNRLLENGRKWRKKMTEENPRQYSMLKSFAALKIAVKSPTLVAGWPDACGVEQKINIDWIQKTQWTRFAWLANRNLAVGICWALSQEDALRPSKRIVYKTILSYIKGEFGKRKEKALDLWKILLRKTSKMK